MKIHPLKTGRRRADWAVFRRLLGYTRPYRARLVLGAVFGVLFGGSSVGFLPAARRQFGQIFTPAESSALEIMVISLVLLLLGAGRGLGFYFSKYFIEWIGTKVVTDLRIKAFDRLMMQSLGHMGKGRTGDVMSRITNDAMMMQHAVSTVIVDLVQQPFVLVGTMGYIFYLDWKLSLGMVVLLPLCLIPVTYFGRRVRRFSLQGQQAMGDMTALLQESLTGLRIVKAFGMEPYEAERFNERANKVFRRLMKIARARAANDPVMVELAIIGLCGALFYAWWVQMPFNTLLAFALGFIVMYEPIKKISRLNIQIQQSSSSAERLFDIIDAPLDIVNRPDAQNFDEPLREIRFENVSFAYRDEPVLADVNLAVKAGQVIAVVGSSGSGKTTLVSLLPRFYDVAVGRLTLNGVDIRDLTLESLRGKIGLVTQETILFNDTVANNIRYGKMDATREEIEYAARRANAHLFIEKLPMGYETVIGERGSFLSGGEQQRLSIARALLRNPPILILDEATSALDTESERLVQEALDKLMADRTVFAIAHRLSTIQHADRIIVLDRGRIVEEGNHAKLLEKGGVYKYLYDLQFDT